MLASRRKVLKDLMLSVGAIGLPPLSAADVVAEFRFYASAEGQLVSRLADLIIPRTETPGAVDALVPYYLDTLYLQWASQQTKATHRAGLANVAAALTAQGTSFVDMNNAEAVALLTRFDASAFAPEPAKPNPAQVAYRQLKQQICNAYYLSEPGALEELDWQATPGRWVPSMPIEASSS